jgi:hypothetical protein
MAAEPGGWAAAADTTTGINPSDTDDVVEHFPRASAAEAEQAILAKEPAWLSD